MSTAPLHRSNTPMRQRQRFNILDTPRPPRTAFTIVEAVISLVVASVMIVSAISAISVFGKANTLQKDQYRASLLARRLMAEIERSLYVDPANSGTLGPEAGESTGSRSAFNDVDDYTGWSESPPQNKDGTVIPGYTGWTRAVTVVWVDPNNPASVQNSDMGVKRITVTVTDPRGRKTTLVSLRSSTGAYEKRPSANSTYVSWVGVTLQVGSDPAAKADGAVTTLGQIP
jgi:type II secretory pathway pseudopilin PulG